MTSEWISAGNPNHRNNSIRSYIRGILSEIGPRLPEAAVDVVFALFSLSSGALSPLADSSLDFGGGLKVEPDARSARSGGGLEVELDARSAGGGLEVELDARSSESWRRSYKDIDSSIVLAEVGTVSFESFEFGTMPCDRDTCAGCLCPFMTISTTKTRFLRGAPNNL